MQFGFVRAAAGAPALHLCDPARNAAAVAASLREADRQKIKLFCFPELCLTGATAGDLLRQQVLLSAVREALHSLIADTRELDVAAVVGLPWQEGDSLYSAAAVIHRGRLLGLAGKENLTPRDRRLFTPGPQHTEVFWAGAAVPLGTDLLFRAENMPAFSFAVEIGEDFYAPVSPSARHCRGGAAIIACPSALPEIAGRAAARRAALSAHSARHRCGYLLAEAGAGESTADFAFGGHSLIAETGDLLAEAAPFSGGVAVTEIDVERIGAARRMDPVTAPAGAPAGAIGFTVEPGTYLRARKVPPNPFLAGPTPADDDARCDELAAIAAEGLRRRVQFTGSRSVVLGISGGLDSTLALLTACRAFDALERSRKGVIALSLPGFGTGNRTKNNADLLCDALGVSARAVDIRPAVTEHLRDIGHDPDLRDTTYENAQARERTQILMDVAGDEGGFVVGTGDLSEIALGFCTFGGDHLAMYNVNAGIPKTVVRAMVRRAAEWTDDLQLSQVLLDIAATPVSPELLPGDQLTEELIGPYELHDFFLYYLARWGFSPRKVLSLAEGAFEGRHSPAAIRRWLGVFCRRFFAAQFKRNCSPDGAAVGALTLSPRGGFSMPSDAAAKLWLEELEEI